MKKTKRSSVWGKRVKPEDFLRTFDMTDEALSPELHEDMVRTLERMDPGTPVPKPLLPKKGRPQ